MSLANELRDLEDLRMRGSLTDAEFEQAKSQLLNSGPDSPAFLSGGAMADVRICGIAENTWSALMHLSQLLTFSMAGIVVPILMWILSKDESEVARQEGARMMNWLLSSMIYAAVSLVLCFVAVGIPMLIALAIMQIAFPIIAAIKAHDGTPWSYPFAIRFFPEF